MRDSLKRADLIHEIFPVGWFQCNCHVVGDPATREGIVIDPGDDVDTILGAVEKHRLKIRAIAVTHAHIDHVGGLRKMRDATGAPVLMHPDDLELYQLLDTQAAWIGMRAPARVTVEGALREGDVVRWGGFEARVLHTPGHSRGSSCLYLPPAPTAGKSLAEPGALFAGDTLFAGSIGRTDLWGGSLDEILRSIHTKLLALPEDTVVYPGHGPATTIGEERESNPFLRRM